MAEGEGSAATAETYDLKQFLGSSDRDFLVDSKGNQVSISERLQGKTVGLFLSTSYFWDSYSIIANDLAEEYDEINDKEGGQFEVVFVPIQDDDLDYRSKMPWLAVPSSDSEVRQRLKQQFTADWRPEPVLVILQTEPGTTSARVINENAIDAVIDYGVEAFPFSKERIKEVQDAAKPSNTIADVLGSRNRDYLLNKAREKVPLSELKGKFVGILFYFVGGYNDDDGFLPELAKAYEDLNQRGEPFELVLLSLDWGREQYDLAVAAAPCPLALPFEDRRVKRLLRRWRQILPRLVVLGPDGNTVNGDAVDLVRWRGADAYPFTPDKQDELWEEQWRQGGGHTLESLLVAGELDYVVRNNGTDKVPVRDLVGKAVLLYFSAYHLFGTVFDQHLVRLVEMYNELKAQGKPVEVVFVSSDDDEVSYIKSLELMPWLALPMSGPRGRQLTELLEVDEIPSLVAIEPSGKRAGSLDVMSLIVYHGAAAFPFTKARAKELEAWIEDGDQGWPDRLKIEDHEHNLAKTKEHKLECDMCSEDMNFWAFRCEKCDFNAHIKCALEVAAGEVPGVLGLSTADYLVNKADKKVPLSELEGKVVGILFSSASDDCKDFFPALDDAYKDLQQRRVPFELVLLCTDFDSERYLREESPCPLAVPFKKKSMRSRLIRHFELDGAVLPTLVIVDPNGTKVNSNAVKLVEGLGADAYPFTPDKEEELREMQRRQEEEQTLESLLVAGELDYVVRNNGTDKVPVRDLVGKAVLLFFSNYWVNYNEHVVALVEMYNELKTQGKPVEVVFVSSDDDEECYNKSLETMPWLALPPSDPRGSSLRKLLKVSCDPNLVVIESSGKTATLKAWRLIEKHGLEALSPFTKARVNELEAWVEVGDQDWPDQLEIEDHEHELAKTKREEFWCELCAKQGKFWAFCCQECNFNAHTKCALEVAAGEDVRGVLGLRTTDYLVNTIDEKVPPSELEGKVVGILVSSSDDNDCKDFFPVLAKAYKGLKQRRVPFELVRLCAESDPYLHPLRASPCPLFVPKRTTRSRLIRHFEIDSTVLPTLVIVDANGTKVNNNAVKLVEALGADAFPFTLDKEEELKEIWRKDEEYQKLERDDAKDWPEQLTILDHEHELAKTKRQEFVCDVCDQDGKGWAFYCEECDFDAHLKCALVVA